ncbi:hypothetical protein [Neobacillus sp. PS3-40]|uniref:hypothetical protein n=1 Tax=Neobacillus sp. PS3-40 TaxID=3070679 RepID=UPI0027E14C29|nr:hypothetical protein [Neobacillus sp. PS3-40]WML44634.1 hypothetical protein RCG20_01600 [Neobacillus sp. PS3-40]
MKKCTLLVLSVILLSFVLNGCQQQSSNGRVQHNAKEAKSNKLEALDVREAVWNQLQDKVKEQIEGSWKDATVQKLTLHEGMGNIKDKAFIGKEVYLVDFPTGSAVLGGIGVFADINSHHVIGFGYRD